MNMFLNFMTKKMINYNVVPLGLTHYSAINATIISPLQGFLQQVIYIKCHIWNDIMDKIKNAKASKRLNYDENSIYV